MSFLQSLTAGAFGGIISSLLTPVVKEIMLNILKERRDKNNIRTQARIDLQCQINMLCDQLEDRAVIIPLIESFRSGVTEEVMKIREFLRLLPSELSDEKIEGLRIKTVECLEIIKKEENDSDEEWSERHSEDIESLCNGFRNLASNL